jgi:hypothetical protein
MALRYARYGYILENGRVVMDGEANQLVENEDVEQFYLGIAHGTAGWCANRSVFAAAGGSPAALGTNVMQNHFATMRLGAVFSDINALPASQRKSTGSNRNVK